MLVPPIGHKGEMFTLANADALSIWILETNVIEI